MEVSRPRARILGLLVAMCLTMPIWAAARQQQTVNIGFVSDGDWYVTDLTKDLFRDEIISLLGSEFDVRFPADKDLTSDRSVENIRALFEQLLNDADVNVIITMGVVSSHVASEYGDLPKPVIAPFVLDVILQDFPTNNGSSGVKNLNYVSIPQTIVRDIRAFREIKSFDKLTMIVSGDIAAALPELPGRVQQRINSETGINIDFRPVRSLEDVNQVLAAGDVEAVYLTPMTRLDRSEFVRLVDAFKQAKVPTFSYVGRGEVEAGIFAGLNPDTNPRLARRVSLNLQRILLGDDPGTIPYAFSPGEELVINMETARAINVYPPWGVITEAVLLNRDEVNVARHLSMQSAIEEAIEANLDVAAKILEVAAGQENVNAARANLLPQLDLNSSYAVIDDDRTGFGTAERTLSAGLTLNQVLFSDDVLANYSVQQNIQKTRELDLDRLKLDIAREAAVIYLQLLQAKAFLQIQEDNLRLSRSNLELARVRESIGASGRADVFRWESEIASNRRSVIDARATVEVAQIALNRLLRRPQEERFSTDETGMSPAQMIDLQSDVDRYAANPWTFGIYREFLVLEGLQRSPEIQQLSASIAVQERILTNASRAFYLPDVGLQAQYSRFLSQTGEGSGDSPPLTIGSQTIAFPNPDENNWSVGLSLSFPLFTGGQRAADRQNALETLSQLRTERKSLSDKIEQRIRAAGHFAGASWGGIEQANKAANAAGQNLDLVRDAYSQGVLTITDLINAQNATLVANQAAANALYDFLIDLMELYRSVGRESIIQTEQERVDERARLDDYYRSRGVEVND